MKGNKEQSSQMNNEFVVDKIVGHEATQQRIPFRFKLYGYTSTDDTYERSSHIPV